MDADAMFTTDRPYKVGSIIIAPGVCDYRVLWCRPREDGKYDVGAEVETLYAHDILGNRLKD